METPQSLDSLFTQKIFRVPDYQRGYAWQREHFKAFWEDLVNLSQDRSHYTGVLTLKEIPEKEIAETTKEFWLVQAHSYGVFHVVDGQQRLTTFVVFIQAFVDFVRSMPENTGKQDAEIFLNDSLSIADIQGKYLFKTKPTGDLFRTYKFGYTADNPSDRYLRHRILGEAGAGTVDETFYTLNLTNAKHYFRKQIADLYLLDGPRALREIYFKLTRKFLFNQYIIRDEFDVFVAFETMNNRGKKLSDLELLKNRLIYLTTLYPSGDLDVAGRTSLRDGINDAWKEVYHQLGRNSSHPLNDDEFLRAHWTMFFKYSRQTGKDYIRFLLDEHFTPQRIHQRLEAPVQLKPTEEPRPEDDSDDAEVEDSPEIAEAPNPNPEARLAPHEIREFVTSLKESAIFWFNTYYPSGTDGISDAETGWIDRLNRLGMGYFRPLVMAVLKNEENEAQRIKLFQRIERFIFIAFRLTTAKANYKSSEFYNAVRAVDRGNTNVEALCDQLDQALAFIFDEGGAFKTTEFSTIMSKKFSSGSGYYGWGGARYFLYEYELSLLQASRQKKVDWSDLLRSERDMISIEHIYPQKETKEWDSAFATVDRALRPYYQGSLGNLLLLSKSINSSLQNDSFAEKKNVRLDAMEKKIRNGYADGSHSEIEVSQLPEWNPEQVRLRGIRLLKFMEEHWNFRFKDDDQREKLLFLLPPDLAG